VFENAIASVETVNSHSVQVQVLGKVPSFAVDKCSGFNLYLSKDCLDAEIITSKSDAMNVVLPPNKEGEDVV
jgi:adenylyl cyclase-associated protein